jgi:hypothetical protein
MTQIKLCPSVFAKTMKSFETMTIFLVEKEKKKSLKTFKCLVGLEYHLIFTFNLLLLSVASAASILQV